jgi:hypothetical protein
MSLRPLNRDPKYMSGDYANMFDIPVHQSNQGFATRPYVPASCRPGDSVCFSLTNGSIACRPDQDSLLIWRATGDLTSLSIKKPAAVDAPKK